MKGIDLLFFSKRLFAPVAAAAALVLAGCSSTSNDFAIPTANQGPGPFVNASPDEPLIIYSGRNERLIKPLIDQFVANTGIKTEVRYAGSPELGAQLMEEGGGTDADVFLSQDAGALGAVANEKMFVTLPQSQLDRVGAAYRDPQGHWIGVSGRVRVLAYNSIKVPEGELPKSVFELTEPKWKGRIAYAPANASFQSFVTGMRLTVGEDRTKQFLEGLKANEPRAFGASNVNALRSVNTGESDVALVNHYYLYELRRELGESNVAAKNYFFGNGDPGSLINVAGIGILGNTDKRADSARFVDYLLANEAQRYFRDKTDEYPLTTEVERIPDLPALESIGAPKVDLSDLSTLDRTQALLREVGLI